MLAGPPDPTDFDRATTAIRKIERTTSRIVTVLFSYPVCLDTGALRSSSAATRAAQDRAVALLLCGRGEGDLRLSLRLQFLLLLLFADMDLAQLHGSPDFLSVS